eukprot:TRINITY_DN112864_c0_g1_i1.p1 TRINITY_DN112864_c0_g1~~TRINITY_DN112864_c0_g1_i1.p1  ORF type:complete len:287 (-),score=56.69 TRINITY_DN112864_c0_g1_i1:25-885(-)
MAAKVHVQFLDGESISDDVDAFGNVAELMRKLKLQKPPPKPSARLQLVLESRILSPLESVKQFADESLTAIYTTSESSYYILSSDGELKLQDEGDAGWDEEIGNKMSQAQKEELWVPPPAKATSSDSEPRNLARESEGVTITATSNIFRDDLKGRLGNLLRLGSKYGEPQCFIKGDRSFIFAGPDQDPRITVDFGRTVMLQRVGVIGSSDRWIDRFSVRSSEDGSADDAKWEEWGEDKKSHYDGGPVFIDSSSPAPARLIQIQAKSGHSPGARVGPIFAYGYELQQ